MARSAFGFPSAFTSSSRASAPAEPAPALRAGRPRRWLPLLEVAASRSPVRPEVDRPEPAYLFVPEPTWRRLEPAVRPGVGNPLREIAAKYDYTRHAVILVLWNGR